MAKQLREEPSLQLCAVLLRYALQADAAAVQADLAERHLPSLSTLRQVSILFTYYIRHKGRICFTFNYFYRNVLQSHQVILHVVISNKGN